MSIFDEYGTISSGLRHVSPREAVELCNKGAVILDVREDYLNAFKRFDVSHVIYMPLSDLYLRYTELDAGIPLIVADAAGLHSREAAIFLASKGFDELANLAGGLIEWERDEQPLITDINERLNGSCMCQLRPREQKRNK